MKTIGEARAAGFDLLILYMTEGETVRAHKVGLSNAPPATELDTWSRAMSGDHANEKVIGAALSKPGDSAGRGAREVMLWGDQPDPQPATEKLEQS